MAPYKIIVEYDGSDFFGFQRQSGSRTVQEEIEKAITKLGWYEKSIMFAGRTDSGVHAEGQVAAFKLDWNHNIANLKDAINDYLPPDISVLEIAETEIGFHPRYDAKSREYRYQLYISKTRKPTLERYYWKIWPEIDKDMVVIASQEFIGTHDYRLLGCRVPENSNQTNRTIDSIEWRFDKNDNVIFLIKAKSFLYHMVRRIVFILVKIGQKRIEMIDIEKGDLNFSELPAGIAPAKGLFLEKVIY